MGEGVMKWKMGSPTLQNMSPMPMPALMSMAYQLKVLNSGSASGPPILIFP
jgi:hypothetical protein